MRASLLVLAVAALPLPGMAVAPAKANPTVAIAVGELLPAANAQLLKAGWKPVRWQKKDADEEWSPNAQVFFKAGFVAVEDCAGTGSNPCLFRYRSPLGACLKLVTTGEIPSKAQVTFWEFTCPDPR